MYVFLQKRHFIREACVGEEHPVGHSSDRNTEYKQKYRKYIFAKGIVTNHCTVVKCFSLDQQFLLTIVCLHCTVGSVSALCVWAFITKEKDYEWFSLFKGSSKFLCPRFNLFGEKSVQCEHWQYLKKCKATAPVLKGTNQKHHEHPKTSCTKQH